MCPLSYCLSLPLRGAVGSVSTFAAVAAEVVSCFQKDGAVNARTAELCHAVLCTAVGNGKGPRLPKLRDAYASLFDAAGAVLGQFPPPLAADISMWTIAAAAHARLCRPERALNEQAVARAATSLCDALRRLAAERGSRAVAANDDGADARSAAGGRLREPILRQCFEMIEALNRLAKQPWAQPHALEALRLARELNPLWTAKERAAIASWLSTARARGLL